MVEVNKRKQLDELLADGRTTLLLLFGDTDMQAAIHSLAVVEVGNDIRIPVWILDLDLLDEQEVADWQAAKNGYAVLRGKERRVAHVGAASELLLRGLPSILRITKAFTRGA